MSNNNYVYLKELITDYSLKNKLNEDIEVYSVTNSIGFTPSTEYFSKEVYSKDLTNYKIVENGMFAFNPSRINVGSIAWLKDKDRVIISPLYIVFKVDEKKIKQQYLLYYLKGKKGLSYINNLTSGSVRDTLKFSALGQIPIPVINLDRQKYIIDTLDKTQEIIDGHKKQLEELDNLIKATFYDMFGDPVLNDRDWDIVRVIEVCDCMVPGRDKPRSFTGSIPWITIDDLIVNGLTYKSKKDLGLTMDEINEVKRKTIPAGSVIMSCVGNLGITSIAGEEMIINQQLHSFQCKERINNRFLVFVLPCYKLNMERVATSTTVLYMNKTACNNIEIILPPIDFQNKFAEIVTNIEQQKTIVKQSITESQNLFNSLMSKYFD